jgi:TRAP-type C4-dicarboxylate transport system substrate-binding protein
VFTSFHRFHSATNHFYLSRPIFLHRQSYDSWPKPIQEEFRAAVRDAVAVQRDAHVKEEEDAMVEIRKAGGDIVELTPDEHKAFVAAVTPIYGEARKEFGAKLLGLGRICSPRRRRYSRVGVCESPHGYTPCPDSTFQSNRRRQLVPGHISA